METLTTMPCAVFAERIWDLAKEGAAAVTD